MPRGRAKKWTVLVERIFLRLSATGKIRREASVASQSSTCLANADAAAPAKYGTKSMTMISLPYYDTDINYSLVLPYSYHC